MNFFFVQVINEICERSVVAKDRPLRCMVVVNPVAGGFSIPSKWEAHMRTLTKCREKAEANLRRQLHKNTIVNITEGKGSATEITKMFIGRIEKDLVPFYLIISAGGDGTHGEVMAAVYNASAEVRANMAVLRLPMGTGNDGADSVNLSDALNLLLMPARVEFAPAVSLIPNKEGPSVWKGPFMAFNILSVGLDAFVTHQTNTMKRNKPGNSYKLWLDIAALFYDKKYKVDFFDVKAFDEKKAEIITFREKLLLIAMGASGKRSYGSQQLILPDERNVCCMKQMPIRKKLAIKGQVAKGKHAKNPEVILFNAHSLEFFYNHPILAQMDGETILLQPGDFPAKMELTAPVIPLLKKE
ncbi:MAG: diacylglycerol kinase [Treponema sp.]|nr:diacylglycerol kinase [Treponema sp.]MCL2237092.1 diacylglycerol kinase [Treponema sp.]